MALTAYAPAMTDEELCARVAATGAAHATAEGSGNLEGCLSTLVPEPVYEFHPLGKGMRGGAVVRRFYEQFFERVPAMTVGYELLGQWVNTECVAQEYSIWLRMEEGVEHFRVIGVLTANEDGSLLTGERVWASDRYIRSLVGDEIFDSLKPLAAPELPSHASRPVIPAS